MSKLLRASLLDHLDGVMGLKLKCYDDDDGGGGGDDDEDDQVEEDDDDDDEEEKEYDDDDDDDDDNNNNNNNNNNNDFPCKTNFTIYYSFVWLVACLFYLPKLKPYLAVTLT